MTSIIKNQLVKHLSKFTKNLKPEQISLDVLKGNSKLQFIEINEDVLTEILELPSWLKIKKAYCTGVAVNVPWTKLKTCPIQIFIDEINVDVELTNEHKKQPKSNPLGNLGDSSSYGFMNKIIENMSLYISSVEINFDSDVFGGSFMLQRLSVESRSPGWAPVKDLRQTRITCSATNRTLMFKQVSWHLLRIEASAKTSKNEQRSKINAPLRLITSGGKIRIALKKNANDGSVIHARIQTILDDILWVATLPQLRSAISFASYIANLVKESQKNDVITTTNSSDNPFIKPADKDATTNATTTTSAYNIFHFDQTSYHLHVKKIDLHLCDDAHTTSDYPPDWDIDSGAMQVTLHQVLIDVYPKAHAQSDRSTWMRYPSPNPIAAWFRNHLSEQFLTLLGSCEGETTATRLERCWPQLIGFFLVLRVHDLQVQCVSDMNTKKDALTNLFESERHLHSLPSDQQIVHVEFGTFYHPHSDKLPVPNSAVYFQLGPFTLSFDERTTRWCCYVAHALTSAIEDGNLIPEKELDIQPPTIKINLVMPRLVLNLPGPFTDFNFPRRLVTSMSTLTISSSPIDFKEVNRFQMLAEKNEENVEVKDQLINGANKFHLCTSPVWIEIDHGPQTKGFPFLHDVSFNGILAIDKDKVNLLVEPAEDVAVVIDHYQFLQLTRLGDKFTKFFDQLSLDMKHYNTARPSTDIKVDFLVALARIKLFIVLTMGEIASPYDSAAMNNFNHSFMDRLSDIASTKSMTNAASYTNITEIKVINEPQRRINQTLTPEEFPEFTRNRMENDNSPMLDEIASIATSVEDEAVFDYTEMTSDDPFGLPEYADEAITIDEPTINDRTFRNTMAKQANLFMVTLENLKLVGSVADENVKIHGHLQNISLTEKLGIIRREINEMMRKSGSEPTDLTQLPPTHAAVFKFLSPANEKISHVTVDVNKLKATLDDETITHLGAFAKDDFTTENRLRLTIHVHDSCIQIVDRKKKKPLRLKIKSLSIEQDED